MKINSSDFVIEINFLYCLDVVFPQACRDFLDLAETHSRRWQRALQYEREQRTHLEETIEQLAKQHNSLERAWREAPTLVSSTTSATTTNKGETDCVLLTPLGLSVWTSLYWLKFMCNLRLNIIDIPYVEECHFKFKSEVLNWIIFKLEISGFFSLFIHLFIFFVRVRIYTKLILKTYVQAGIKFSVYIYPPRGRYLLILVPYNLSLTPFYQLQIS